MSMTIHLDIVSHVAQLFAGTAEYVIAPAEMGELGIYPRHTQLLTRLKPGVVRIKKPDVAEEEIVYVSGGILEIQPFNITIIADSAIRGHDLDEEKARQSKVSAQEIMKLRGADVDYVKAEVELAQAIAQISAIERIRKNGNRV